MMHPANEVPTNWREVSEKEFAQSNAFTYAPQKREYRQILPEGEPHIIGVWLNFMHDGTGWAMASDYWAGKVRFFKFGCEHRYRELGSAECRERGIQHFGMCWHVSECEKCGDVRSVDTSG